MNSHSSEAELQSLCITPDSSIGEAIACIDKNNCYLALVTDENRRLIGTITDGDIRRALLANIKLDAPVTDILRRKAGTISSSPVTALAGTHPSILLATMQEKVIRQIPLLDEAGRVVGLAVLDELLPPFDLPLQAVVMAGGFGTRLRPMTDDLPKPMLPVGGRPMLERIIGQLRDAGIHEISVTTHYKPEKIVNHFGDGHAFGVEMNYVNEETPLGTGGALGLIPNPSHPLLVINGDILTEVNFRAMLAYHQEQQADMTVAVRGYEVQVPYGVIECDGPRIRSLSEKPHINFFVNAGIYLLQPSVYCFIPNGQHFNMTDLIQWLIDAGRPVVSFLVREYWLDIGAHAEYEQAQDDIKNGRISA